MSGAVAQRYAAALADVVMEQKDAEKVKSGLASFVEAFLTAHDLRNFLDNPSIEPELKRKAIAKIAERMELPVAVRNFVYLIVDHQRTGMLREIEQAFRDELNDRLGIAEAEVISARELSAAEKREITAALEQRTKKKIEANFREDKSLLGGALVRVGSTIYDGSVREQLKRLGEKLEAE
ncbi:MAG TPA: ATP synthase F1 subunit delta [Candidatus Limnocylindrales bacterium]|nr:ATP synthase F1 subunit delta [Candidatus Limnocylindrales bacterium]